MTMSDNPASQKPIMVTPGDPAGIGAEIALKAFAAGCCDFVLHDDADRLQSISNELDLPIKINRIPSPSAFRPDADVLQVLDLKWRALPVPGRPNSANAAQVIAAIETAARWAQDGTIAAMVTNPIAKATLYEDGFNHPGHTEFLGSLAPPKAGGPVMMLSCDALRVVPVTIHIALSEVPELLTTALIVDKARLVDEALRTQFAIKTPRLALCGLNPHAGEAGTIGREDIDVISPAIAQLKAEGINATGPHSADTLFHSEARKSYDVVLGMYHDQVLIPIKTIDFFGGVNITIGLDFIRTSPDHGTGFDIAGKGIARPDSLIAAIRTARQMANTPS